MKVLLLNPPGTKLYARDKFCASVSKADYYWPQVDLIMLSGTLLPHHHVSVIDAIAEKLSPQVCLERIKSRNPGAIIFLTSIASWPEDFEFMARLKAVMPEMKTIAIGGFLLVSAAEVLKAKPFLDAVLFDFTSPHILEYLDGKSLVKDMVIKDGKSIIDGGRDDVKRFEVPIPRHEIFPLDKYRFPLARRKRFTVSLTSLGCPYRCTFCMPAMVKFKLREPANVIDELKHIYSLGIREVLFHDSTFSAVREHAVEVCQGIVDAGLEFSWMCQTRCDCVDYELLSMMKDAGMHSVEFGVESGSGGIRDNMKKALKRDTIIRAFDDCRKLGIRTNAFFILGMPEDDEESILDTIRLAKELNPDTASFSLPMPHPGTPLGKLAGIEGWREGLSFDDVTPPSLPYEKITSERVYELRNKAYRDFYFRLSYILRRLTRITSISEFTNNARIFLSMLKDRK